MRAVGEGAGDRVFPTSAWVIPTILLADILNISPALPPKHNILD